MLGDCHMNRRLINTEWMTNDAADFWKPCKSFHSDLLTPRDGLFSAPRMVSGPAGYSRSIYQPVWSFYICRNWWFIWLGRLHWSWESTRWNAYITYTNSILFRQLKTITKTSTLNYRGCSGILGRTCPLLCRGCDLGVVKEQVGGWNWYIK